MIAKRAALRRAPTRAGDRVPPGGQWLTRNAGPGIDVNDGARCRQGAEIDRSAVGRGQRDRRHPEAEQVPTRAVVDGHRQVRRQ